MQKRIQFNVVFNNSDANDILNHVEGIKSSVKVPVGNELVAIIRKTSKLENITDGIVNPTVYATIDFDISAATHNTTHTGTEFEVVIDVCFEVDQDFYDLLNYIESIKVNAITGAGYARGCRFFDCNHDSNPLIKDGSYSYIDFDGIQVTHPQ